MNKIIDLTGKSFGRFIVRERADNGSNGRVRWLCDCQCGETRKVASYDLKSRKVFSCGCHSRDVARALHYKHGRSPTELYIVWGGMKARCQNPNNKSYPNYGGRGITICDRWRYSFENFLADMGERPTPKHTIERVNNDGNYEPSNCKWATRVEQRANQRPVRTRERNAA